QQIPSRSELTDRTGGHPRGTDRLNHHIEESHDDVVHHAPGLDRDLTCRAPGCDKPATHCDIDHTVPWPHGGTVAADLKCLCRDHHILKTFWGWKDQQLPDGTVIWTLPDGQTYVTTPGSVLLFPALMTPTGPPATPPPPPHHCGNRSAMMPRRRTTRAQNRAHRIANERVRNRADRTPATARRTPRGGDDDPPPF
uniref:HNH endonuclease signature motif containing protein n=1 Tax=Mycolicibacterium vinylchloridicum TaxID=2736928 RepID=UPI001F2B6F37